MADPGPERPVQPAVHSIPLHRAFADALAAELIHRAGGDRLALARTTLLIPNNRAARAIGDAFVRQAGGGLLLPRMVAIGDPELDERLGGFLDPIDAGEAPIPPAIAPLRRQFLLARLIGEARARSGDPIEAAEAIRLAADLGRTLDQLLIEAVPPARLTATVAPELSSHWQASLDVLETILTRWPAELQRIGHIDLADRRNRLLGRIAARWRQGPPAGPMIAAGITTSAPAVARLLRVVARMAGGAVVLPGLDLAMPEGEWQALGPHDPDPESGRTRPSIEAHPQFHLKLLLDRMGVARGEVTPWRRGGGGGAPATRARAIGNAMAPAAFTGKWQTLPAAERRLGGVRAVEFAAPADEAQGIAVALREAMETPGRTAALVTPDRALARRVVAHLARWGIAADDSAGVPLSVTAAGTLLLALAEAAAERFAPVPLLALLKHPLVRAGEARLAWLEGVRLLDRALRGPRPAAGLAGVTRHLTTGDQREATVRSPARGWWEDAAALLVPLEEAFGQTDPAALVAALREAATRLAGDAAWAEPAGRAAAVLIADAEAAAPDGPPRADPAGLPALIRTLLDAIAVRPPQGGHPRLFVWGLIEARLQQADLVILAGLNEGVWPAAPAPDPWLAPRIRRDLGLPGLERRIGLAAHDFASGLGGRQVLVTRARRDARAPAIASRFWLRLEAMTGGVTRAPLIARWAAAIDRPDVFRPADRPRPAPPITDRPKRIAVTKLDRLKADPFAFYADTMLRLSRWDAVDADPSPAWRGSAVHAVFEAWMAEDACDPAKLADRARTMLDEVAAHPVLKALWEPRLMAAIDWVAASMAAMREDGRRPIVAELDGKAVIGAVELYGKVDRIDRLADGTLAIVDYKTGKAPSAKSVAAGFAMQLGLLGLIAEHGGFPGIAGSTSVFEYWSLAKSKDGFGQVSSPVGEKKDVVAADFTALAAHNLREAAAAWLTGDAPFTARLRPDYSPYTDYDQLMRLDEWYGRADG